MIKKILCAMLGLLFTISANAACNLYTTTNSSAGYIDGSGVVQNVSSYLATDYIAVNSSTEYTVYIKQNAAISGHGVRIAFYDTNKQFISPRLGGDAPSAGQYIYNLTSPANAKYIRMSTYDSNGVVDRTIVQGRYTVDTIPTNMSQCATCDGTVVNYTSATGTGVQNGTPTPTNPIEPTFYKQGNMILRKVGDIADSYDATTGKITRRVGVKVLDGSETWRVYSANAYATNPYFATTVTNLLVGGNPDTKLFCNMLTSGNIGSSTIYKVQYSGDSILVQPSNDILTVENFKSWLAQQYSAGTPVTVWYPLKTETTEDWTETSYCEIPIKIATTKYNETKFRPLNTALQNAISVVDSVVSNTITQAASIATLQAQKQTRPNDIADDNEKCPAGKKCLLVEDASGVPHWYEIVERYSRLPDGYTELEYIQSSGSQYIDTGWKVTQPNIAYDVRYQITDSSNQRIAGCQAPGYSDGATLLGNGWIFSNKNNTSVFSADTNVHSAQFVCSNNECTYTRDAETMSATLGTFVQNDVNFALFGLLMGERPSSYAQVKIYHFKIYDNGVLVRDFVPAKRGDVVGMYDTVSGTFFTNAGTGEFIAGDPVSE